MTPKARNPMLLAPRYLLRAVGFAMRGGIENPVSSLSVAQPKKVGGLACPFRSAFGRSASENEPADSSSPACLENHHRGSAVGPSKNTPSSGSAESLLLNFRYANSI